MTISTDAETSAAPGQEDSGALTADPTVIRKWLGILFARADGHVSICSDADNWTGERFTVDPAGLDAATDYAVSLDRKHARGIYAQSTTLREPPTSGRGGEDLAYGLTHLWADGDYGTVGHKPGLDDLPAPPDADTVVKVVADSGLPEPTGWSFSGGGANALWMLDEMHAIGEDRERVKKLTTDWQTILGATAYRAGYSWDTGVGNLDRLMKLIGTVNRKRDCPERPTSIGPTSGALYALADLYAVADSLAPGAHATMAQAAEEKRQRQAARLGRHLPPPRPPRDPRTRPQSGTGPLDVLADMLEFRDVLEPAGFTYEGQHSDGREKWKRPAAGGDSASSAYSVLCDDHVAVNWSDRADLPVGAQPPGQKLTIGTLYAHLNYGGDTSEAARDVLRAAGGRTAHGTARRLPAPVLAEVKRRCMSEPSRTGEPATEDMWSGAEDAPTDEAATAAPQSIRPGHLPAEFYNARPILKHIRQAAHSRACPADVVLYSLLARLSGMLSHHIRAETGIGSRASLNTFAVSVGNSGTGKSIGKDCVRDLMPPVADDFRDGLPIGTGEGIAETFMGSVEEPTGELHQRGPNRGDPVMHRVRKQVRHNAFFYIDEGQTLARIGERTGSTLGETLRRAAVGEALGQTNASEERTRYIPAGSYSMGLLIGLQPSIASVLLADTGTGTPQRFFWAWSVDPSIPDKPEPWPGPIEKHPGHKRPDGPVNITFPAAIREQLWRDRVAAARGEIEVSELDGHAGLMKVKMSALLALLDDHEAVTDEDWRLAEVMWECSCSVRDSLVVRAQREAAAERQREEDAKVRQELRAHAAKADADLSLERVARLVRKHASQVGGITFGYLKRALASRDRALLDKAVDLAESRDWVVLEGDRVCVRTAD